MGNLTAAMDLAPEHLSCYGLKVEEGTPLFARRDTADLPGDEAQAEMYLKTVEDLARRGYQQYEISNFARPGRESRHNLKYWTLGEYAGFGPGAHSDVGGVRYAYARDLESYIRGVRAGEPMLSEREAIPPMDRSVPNRPSGTALRLALRCASASPAVTCSGRCATGVSGRTRVPQYEQNTAVSAISFPHAGLGHFIVGSFPYRG